MESYYLMMDVGGTGIKTGILDAEGKLVKEIEKFPARAKEDKETIFSNFVEIILRMEAYLPKGKLFEGIGMAFPGPFDYEKGISLMQGLDKYDAIYGAKIQKEIERRLEKRYRFLFLHDVEAFALGAGILGPAAECEKIFCLCIGTGAGSAFLEHGSVVKERADVPAHGWIYDTAFRDGIIDDYVSARGLSRQAEELGALDGAALSALAAEGNIKALSVFRRFGEDMAEAVIPFLQKFQPDGCIIGGQIAKSFLYFGTDLLSFCKEAGIRVFPVSDTSRWVLAGLYEKFCREDM